MPVRNHDRSDAEHLLRKLLVYGGAEVAAPHQWPSEADRWKELAFSLLAQTTALPQNTVRAVIDHLAQLHLLDIATLAQLLEGKRPRLERDRPTAKRVIQVLREGGFRQEEAVRALTVVCEAAAALSQNFQGKIQLYLRRQAERMVKEAGATFRFSGLDQREQRYAFTLWLQNVVNMPLPLPDDRVEAFCQAHGLTGTQLIEAADELDLNVALVDDLVRAADPSSEASSKKSQPPKRASARRRTLRSSHDRG